MVISILIFILSSGSFSDIIVAAALLYYETNKETLTNVVPIEHMLLLPVGSLMNLFFSILFFSFFWSPMLAVVFRHSIAHNFMAPKSIRPAIFKPAFISVAFEALLSILQRAAGTLPAK